MEEHWVELEKQEFIVPEAVVETLGDAMVMEDWERLDKNSRVWKFMNEVCLYCGARDVPLDNFYMEAKEGIEAKKMGAHGDVTIMITKRFCSDKCLFMYKLKGEKPKNERK
jgi:hypothetical protein